MTLATRFVTIEPMVELDLVVRGGTVVPVNPDREWFPGWVGVREGRIVSVGRGEPPPARRTLDAADGLVLPGFVQGHVHVVQSLLRHQADGLDLLEWLRRRTWPYEAALDGDGVEAAAELGIAELLSGGTTTVLDFGTTHDHDRVFGAAERLGIRMISGKTHMDRGEGASAALLEETERSLAEAEELGGRWHGAAEGRLRYAVAPRFILSCTERLLTGCVELARRRGWLLQTHAAENRREVAAVRAETGLGNIEALDRLGLLGPDVILAHCVHLGPGETERLGATKTRVCHCPGANLKLGSGIADVPRLLELGVEVLLGADGAPCNNRLSIFHEMALAGTLHGLRSGPGTPDAWTVLELATRRGAEALGLGAETGSLEPGKAADMVIVDTRGWALLPDGDPASRLVFGATAADVRHVLVAGRIVVEERRLATADPDEIRRRAREAWRATAARMNQMEVAAS